MVLYGAGESVTLYTSDDGTGDIGLQLIEDGFLLVEPRRERRLHKLVAEYKNAQVEARKGRVRLLPINLHTIIREHEKERITLTYIIIVGLIYV